MNSFLILLFGSILGGTICFGDHGQPSVGRHDINFSAPFSDGCCDLNLVGNETIVNLNATNDINVSNITQEQLIVNESTSESSVEGAIDHTNSTINNCFVNCTLDDEYIVNDENVAQETAYSYRLHRKVSIYLAYPLFSSLYQSLLVTTPLSSSSIVLTPV